MKMTKYESEMAMVGPCALCGQLVRVKEHDTLYRLEGMGGMVCAQCAAEHEAEAAPPAAGPAPAGEPRLVIGLNSEVASSPCAVCGHSVNLAAGPELLLSDGWRAVCLGCAESRAPELVALLKLSRAAQDFAARTGAETHHHG